MSLIAVSAALLFFHLAITFVCLARTITAVRRLRARPFLECQPEMLTDPEGPSPLVSIIIPARNEQHNLLACLHGVLTQRGPRIQVVIVDDNSEDKTLEIARAIAKKDSRVLLLQSAQLPAGWIGKTYALHQGVGVSTGEWLLFIDADVRVSPYAVGKAVAFATAHSIDLLSLSPLQRAEGFWERLLQPVVFDLLNEKYDPRAVNNPNSPAAAANGQFIMVRRPAYFQIGGHEAVRNQVLEDVALARRAKQAGLRIYFANTRSLAEARMYRGLVEIWEGWTKNLFPLLNSRHSAVLGTVLGQLFLWVLPFGTLVASLVISGYNKFIGLLPLISGGIAIACLFGAAIWLLSQIGGVLRYSLLLPFGKLMLAAMIVHSWYRHVTGQGIRWKDREYKG